MDESHRNFVLYNTPNTVPGSNQIEICFGIINPEAFEKKGAAAINP